VDATIALVLTLVGITGTAVVLTGEPARQAVTMAVFGLVLALLFLIVQAPDVALSQIGVESAIVPLLVMLAVRKVRRHGSQGSG
jgi:energy-converting hydrogenase B subunit D